MVDKKPLLKSGYISVDRIKDDFIYLVNEFPKEQRYIVSFMLSTLLNNISNKKDGMHYLSQISVLARLCCWI